MKTSATRLPPPESFAPVVLTIEFASLDELDLFGAIFNTTPIARALRSGGAAESIRGAIRSVGGDPNRLHAQVVRTFRAEYAGR